MKTKQKQKINIEDFHTTKFSEDGVKLDLVMPDGTETEHWVKVAGKDSKAFRLAASRANTARMALTADDKRDKEQDVEAFLVIKTKLIAGCVLGWSFTNIDCTPENVVEFLLNAPDISDSIDFAIGDRKLFMKGLNN